VPAAGNAEETKQRILEAATSEFAAFGVAGARVDRIAKVADCNKNLIYVYFTNKDNLFISVLERNLPRIYSELKFDPTDLPDFASRVFDYAHAHPELMRLLAWSALELPAEAAPVRREARQAKFEAIRQAQSSGILAGWYPPDFLLTMIMSLATAWSAVSPFGPAFSPPTKKQIATMKQCVATAVATVVGAPSTPTTSTNSG
jgi:AcrR family transcriptional regulator